MAQRHELSEPSLAGNAVVGVLPDQVSRVLWATAPDPRVARFAHLEPVLRRLAVDLDQLPERPGFLPATREQVLGGQVGYVREQDWRRLQQEQDPAAEVPFFDRSGIEMDDDQGGGITLDGFVLDGFVLDEQPGCPIAMSGTLPLPEAPEAAMSPTFASRVG